MGGPIWNDINSTIAHLFLIELDLLRSEVLAFKSKNLQKHPLSLRFFERLGADLDVLRISSMNIFKNIFM